MILVSSVVMISCMEILLVKKKQNLKTTEEDCSIYIWHIYLSMHFDLFYFWRKKEKTFYETCSRWVISTTSHLDCKESVSNFTNIFQHYGWFYFSCYEFLSLHFTFQKLFFTPVHSQFYSFVTYYAIHILCEIFPHFHLKLCIHNLNLI